jgi:hypothetical protein
LVSELDVQPLVEAFGKNLGILCDTANGIDDEPFETGEAESAELR